MSDNFKTYVFLLIFVILASIGVFIIPQGRFLSNASLFIGCISMLISTYYFTKIKLIGIYDLLKEFIDKIKGV